MRKVLSALAENAIRQPEKIVFQVHEKTISYRVLYKKVISFAEFLHTRDEDVIGLLAANSLEWVIADLAVGAAGKCLVPLPTFFSDAQLAHIVRDTGITFCLADEENFNRAHDLARDVLLTHQMSVRDADENTHSGYPDDGRNATRIIYTSGSTGQPKGVQLSDQQVSYSASALAEAIQASHTDSYLSVLPFALLLEEICAIHVPVLVGGSTTIDPEIAGNIMKGNAAALVKSMEQHQPSVSVLVPDLLRAWVGGLIHSGQKAPPSLRYVAIGGAPIPTGITELARGLGIPAYEGYGLSECCSVVSLGRPGDNSTGTVGQPLAGLNVHIEDGEIVISGPSVMGGYLRNKASIQQQNVSNKNPRLVNQWRTGDLGYFDNNGHLVIQGRRDNLLVMSNGRNVSPEWVETRLQGDMRILRATVICHEKSHLLAIIIPTTMGTEWFANSDQETLRNLIDILCHDLPAYAKPGNIIICAPKEFNQNALLTSNGRPCRNKIAGYVSSQRDRVVHLSPSIDVSTQSIATDIQDNIKDTHHALS